MEHKSVTISANPAAGERCHVSILDLYLSKLPTAAHESDIFYCKPMVSAPTDKYSPWYFPLPIGKNTLAKMVQDMCTEAKIAGKRTNHSLRVAGTSSLHEAGVPEKLIQSRTGHRSLESLRTYERVSSDQEIAVSRILTGEIDTYDEATSSCKSMKSETLVSTSCSVPQVQYNNCTVTVFSGQQGPSAVNPIPPIMPFFPPYNYYPPASYCDASALPPLPPYPCGDIENQDTGFF